MSNPRYNKQVAHKRGGGGWNTGNAPYVYPGSGRNGVGDYDRSGSGPSMVTLSGADEKLGFSDRHGKGDPTNHNKKGLSKSKAKEMLRHGEVGGKPLTKKQKGLFGAVAGGAKLRKY